MLVKEGQKKRLTICFQKTEYMIVIKAKRQKFELQIVDIKINHMRKNKYVGSVLTEEDQIWNPKTCCNNEIHLSNTQHRINKQENFVEINGKSNKEY